MHIREVDTRCTFQTEFGPGRHVVLFGPKSLIWKVAVVVYSVDYLLYFEVHVNKSRSRVLQLVIGCWAPVFLQGCNPCIQR